VEKYPSKISGPLLDRIDLHVEVPAVPFTRLAEMSPSPTLERSFSQQPHRLMWSFVAPV
jgi:magnesium chelatase family protein